MINRLNRVTCRARREEELERRLAEVASATRGDPDCEAYRWLRSDAATQGTVYFNLSRWRTEDGWRRHLVSEGFKTFGAAEAADPCLAGPPEHHGLTDLEALA